MLPPIGAALSASVDYQDAGRQAMRASLAATSGVSAPTTPLPANLLGGGRIDILSLSGQVQLAQGLSIFAETIGSFLKISRREGEGLVDYANRLAEALKSLSLSQRAALEQSIAQLVRGVTLRILTEILNNPLGPEAARLTAYLESAPAADRDLATWAVVSSYRQNDAAVGSSASPASASVRTPLAGAAPAPAELPAKAAGGDQGPAAVPAAHVRGAAASATAGPTSPTSVVTAVPPAQGAVAEGGEDAGVPSLRPQQSTQPVTRGGMSPMQLDGSDPDRTPPAARSPELPGPGETRAGGSSVATEKSLPSRAEVVVEPRPAMSGHVGTPVIYDAPALARFAQMAVEDPKNRFIQNVLFQNSAPGGSASESTGASKAPVPQVLAPVQAEQSAEDGATQIARPAPASPLIQSGEPIAARAADTESALPAPAPALGNKVTANVSAAPHLVADPAAYILAAPMLAREGLAQVLVTYPPAPRAPDEEERDVERVSPIDEDGGHRSSHQDAQGGDGDPEDDPSPEDDDGGAVQSDELSDHAQDLYWRMADLS